MKLTIEVECEIGDALGLPSESLVRGVVGEVLGGHVVLTPGGDPRVDGRSRWTRFRSAELAVAVGDRRGRVCECDVVDHGRGGGCRRRCRRNGGC